MEEKTVWQRIADGLKSSGIDAYPPATKGGECKKEYVVIKGDGSSQIGNYSSKVHYYSLLLYVPQNRYTDLEKFKKEVEKAMADNLYPMLMPTGQEQPDFYDDAIKAHLGTLQYRVNVRDKHL